MPVYNGEKYVAKALDSLLAQTFSDYELIISDDDSTDRTEAICREYASRDSRVRYLRQPRNAGAVKNFRFVLNEACGEYFMWASHDDLWSTTFIERLAKLLDADPNCSLAFSDYRIKNLQGEGEIKICVSSATSKSPLVRYLARVLDAQPALIFGLFRRRLANSEDLRLFDWFEVNFSILMALRGNIRIVNEYLFTWGIDRRRKSKNWSDSGKSITYIRFYLSQVRLMLTRFSVLKVCAPLFILTYLIFVKWIQRRFNTAISDIDFE